MAPSSCPGRPAPFSASMHTAYGFRYWSSDLARRIAWKPWRPAVPLRDGDIQRAPCGSMGMTLWQSARRHAPEPSSLLSIVGGYHPTGSLHCSCCTQAMSWQQPTTPLSCRGDQALAADTETRRRSVDGCVCLRNSARTGLIPADSSSWTWICAPCMTVAPREEGIIVFRKHLSTGSAKYLSQNTLAYPGRGLPIPSLMESSPVWQCVSLRAESWLLWIPQAELQTERWPSQ